MHAKSILWIVLCVSAGGGSQLDYGYDGEEYEDWTQGPVNCSTTEAVKGGQVTYSQGGLEGSVLSYHCSPGQYPHPLSYRLCGPDGDWSPMRSASGRLVSHATCRDILCPAQLQLDHGDIWPRNQWFRVGATQSFSCQEGFTLYGSAQRNCTLTGGWTGLTPICDNHAEDCSDPGIPPGAQRSAGPFQVGQKFSYSCQTGLDLLGSAERVCLENREWSGSMPRCLGRNTYDSPSDVAKAMTGSLAGLMDVLSPEEKKTIAEKSFARTFNVAKGSRMNVYILLDTSGSIQRKDFEKSRNATIALIEKLDSYEVKLKFHVLSFASEAKDIVDITESEISGSTDDVIWNLRNFNYHSHGEKTGTNLYAALQRVNEVMSYFKENSAQYHFNETQNVIVIATDGFSNTGKDPQIALLKIRNLLGYHSMSSEQKDETLLDVYAFGIGEQVNKEQLNALASQKSGETHVFFLKDYETLGEVFNSIISDKSVTMCGVAQEVTPEDGVKAYTNPWHVTVVTGTSLSCFGSILSQNWVLTAAHCFARASTDRVSQQVQIEHGDGMAVSKAVVLHPQFNIRALKHRNVSEFYDYDVALIQVNESIPLSWKARPICLPCTVPASRAMKSVNTNCQQHRKALLPHQQTEASFINSHRNPKRRVTHIQTQAQRQSCVEKARQVIHEPTDVRLDEYVTDRFLCSGGSSGYKDAVSCKGDSGGSLFLQQKNRYFQVGVLSWGITNVCDPANRGKYSSEDPPPNARDFHIDLFQIMPWLKQHLGEEIQFLPDVD
ncbi:complement factor B [Takifugu rubripes]|uniref:C3/C5 convertase n=1 Tax=Takifugu rubripes TaxID=31033 RepID=H2T8C1_TAKRU|nr:complement factor B-like [Takifugu rubripes]